MIEKQPPRDFTNARIIYETMKNAYENGGEFDISRVENCFGEIIPRTTIAQTVSRISSEYFPKSRFYTRTIDGKLMLGCHTTRDEIEALE